MTTPPELSVLGGIFGEPHKSERVKKMIKAIRASVLVLLLACSAQAGWIQNGVADEPPPPPPPPATAAQGPTTDGEIDAGVTASAVDGIMGNDAAITFAQVVLNLLALS
jgi:hypothetical protein